MSGSSLENWHWTALNAEGVVVHGVVTADDGDTLTLFCEKPARHAMVMEKAALKGFIFFPTPEDVATWVAAYEASIRPEEATEAEGPPKKQPYKPTGA